MMMKRDEKRMQDRRPAVAPAAALPCPLLGQFQGAGNQALSMALGFLNNLILGSIVSLPRWRPVLP